ncbi:MAG: DUF6961 family protein [Novosphingobium sp.]|jgi:hypothetical protein|uniref:DUF6961 family protein n=1 Tax=Novosphingobium sp. TaxID=1874826 RepID=UPI00391984DF
MTRDEETLAVALLVKKEHGARASVYVAEQIGAQVIAGDQAGVARWQEIASALAPLLKKSH